MDNATREPLPENPVSWKQLSTKLFRLKLEETRNSNVSWMQKSTNGRRIGLASNSISPFTIYFLGGLSIPKSNLLAVTPIFENSEMKLVIEVQNGKYELIAGMDGKGRYNTLNFGAESVEFFASARWLDHNVLSIVWRTMRYVQSTSLVIMYHLDQPDVSLTQTPRGDSATIKGIYTECTKDYFAGIS